MRNRIRRVVRNLGMYDEGLGQCHQCHEGHEYCILPALWTLVLYLVCVTDVYDCESCKDDDTHGVGKHLAGDQEDMFSVELLLREEDDKAYSYQHDRADRHKDPLHVRRGESDLVLVIAFMR